MSKFCTNCGAKLDDKVKFCTGCGQAVDGEAAEPAKTVTTAKTNTGEKQTNGLAVAGFVVSLVSSLLCCGIFNLVGLILSIIGLVKAKDYNGSGKGLAIAGIVICGVVMLFSIIAYIIVLSAGGWSEFYNEIYDI